jgi:pimeloyl-ACP methyl ester carboxylesterase
MPEAVLSAGTIEYDDTGDTGPVVVFLNGLLINGSMWRHVVGDLRNDHRCVVPTMPLGAHRQPMRAGADLSGRGVARLVAEFMEHLDLHDVTLVGSDWGGAQLVVAEGLDGRVGRLVLVSQEAFENFPPGLPGKSIWLSSKVPGALNVALQLLRLRAMRRSPMMFGWMSKRPVPNDIMDAWLKPALTSREIRGDLRTYLRATRKGDYVEAAEGLGSFDRPALVVWAAEDRIMTRENGGRLAERLPDSHLIQVPDSYTLISEDQPAALSDAIRQFVRPTSNAAS